MDRQRAAAYAAALSVSNAVVYLNPTSSNIDLDGMTIGAKSGLVLPPPPRSLERQPACGRRGA